MTVLVIGANGLVGSSLVRICQEQGVEVSGTYHTERPAFDVDLFKLDLHDADRLPTIFEQVEPTTVVNCAAYTDVDGCEENSKAARAINGVAPGQIAELCEARDISFVHLSTDYVFDGQAKKPYLEEDEPNPLQVYGETKLEGEQRAFNADPEAIICRLSFVWGRHGATGSLDGFPAWVLDRARDEKSVPLFTDQWVTPTRAGDAANVILDLLERDDHGTFHVASRDCVTPYEFGQSVLTKVDDVDVELLEESSIEDVQRSARRPRHACLSTGKLETTLDSERSTIELGISKCL